MLSLLLAAVVEAQSRLIITSLQPLQTITIETQLDVPALVYARDEQFEYLGTPRGVYRAARLADGPLQRIAFAEETVHALAVHDGALYVAKSASIETTSDQHTLVRSRDGGASFEPIDAGLLDCSSPPCRYLVPRQISFGPNRIFATASGNLVASGDDGVTWTLLLGASSDGKPQAQLCPLQYERIEKRVIYGSECPLDIAWIARGTLREDLLAWDAEREPVDTPGLENRNIQFIRHLGNGVVYAGVEGGLLESTDGGSSFRFVLFHPLDDEVRYPYIAHLVTSSRDPNLILVGGFDKRNNVGYLAYSNDRGETWTDASALTGNAFVTMLVEDADGRLLVGLRDGDQHTIAEVVLQQVRKRRAVRPS